MIETLAQVTAPPQGKRQGFCAGIVLWDDRVVEAADIVKIMRGWSRKQVRDYCAMRHWEVHVVHQLTRDDPRTAHPRPPARSAAPSPDGG